MIVFDLKPVLCLGGLAVLAVALCAVWLDRRWGPARAGLPPAFAAAPLGIVECDAAGQYRYANAYACRLLDLPAAPGLLPEAAWRAALQADLVAARTAAPATTGHYRVVTLGAQRFVGWWVYPNAEGGALLFLTDVSAQQRAGQTAQAFLSQLSHELRTPLMAILAHLAVVRTPDLPAATHAQSLDLIQREVQRITRLVSSLLDLTRLEAAVEIAAVPVDCVLVAEDAVAEVILRAEARGIALGLQVEGTLPRVLGDADRLKQVFLNLLDNAVAYARASDRVTVALERVSGGVQCSVTDSGPGIPAAHLPFVTQRLYRVRTDVPGNGLGLALVEEILRRHHSRLELESRAAGEAGAGDDAPSGTRAWFVLPVVGGAHASRDF